MKRPKIYISKFKSQVDSQRLIGDIRCKINPIYVDCACQFIDHHHTPKGTVTLLPRVQIEGSAPLCKRAVERVAALVEFVDSLTQALGLFLPAANP
ncbi:MAG TPA: hypothetical protein V6C57_08075 [Coleofasciculaceae cyanobacterium]